MVSAEFSEGISETIDVLNHMDKSYIDKIPEEFKEFLYNNKSNNYTSNLDFSKKINEIKLKEKTKNILATIYLDFWCSPEEKEKYKIVLKKNEQIFQEQLKDKYKTEELFKKNNDSQKITKDNVAIKEYNDSFFRKIIYKIKSFFHKD